MGNSTITINTQRVRAVAEAFKEVGIEGIQAFEDHDPQMVVAKAIHELCGEMCVAVLATNALVSYMLEVKGEEYWESLANYVRERGCPNNFMEVIELVEGFTARKNRRFLNAKLRRLRKLRECLSVMGLALKGDLRAYGSGVARCLGSPLESKTVVFSVKMAYYGLRASGRSLTLPESMPIPVDFRVARVTHLSRMVETDARTRRDVVKILMSKSRIVRRVWTSVSKISGIPPLNLDAPVWVIGGYVDLGRKSLVMEALRRLSLTKELGEARVWKLTSELLYSLPE